MKRFKSARHAQQFLSAHDQINNLFLLPRHQMPATRAERTRAFQAWHDVCGIKAAAYPKPALPPSSSPSSRLPPNNLTMPVNSSVKRCRVVKDRIRLWKQGVRDVVMEICCALHNFRVRLTPWQPMV